jgi:hypothetical protein
MDSRRVSQSVPKKMHVVGLLALAIIAATASAQTAAPAGGATRAPVHEIPRSQRGEMYYARRYGVDHLQVRSTSSGQSLEFRYRVLDPSKAARLNDKKASPVLTDQRTGTKLAVPAMENIGSLRQVAPPVAGKEYWMVFHNPGKLVKPGDKVDIVIGPVKLGGLVVQ